MEKKYDKWILFILDMMTRADKSEISRDNQIMMIRCRIYSNITTALKALISGQQLPPLIVREEFLYFVIKVLGRLFPAIPENIRNAAESRAGRYTLSTEFYEKKFKSDNLNPEVLKAI